MVPWHRRLFGSISKTSTTLAANNSSQISKRHSQTLPVGPDPIKRVSHRRLLAHCVVRHAIEMHPYLEILRQIRGRRSYLRVDEQAKRSTPAKEWTNNWISSDSVFSCSSCAQLRVAGYPVVAFPPELPTPLWCKAADNDFVMRLTFNLTL